MKAEKGRHYLDLGFFPVVAASLIDINDQDLKSACNIAWWIHYCAACNIDTVLWIG